MGSQLAAKIEAALTEAMKALDADFAQVHGAHYALSTQEGYGYTPRLALSEVAEIAAKVALE